jgi:RimK family alpha-L-glutamate ligase
MQYHVAVRVLLLTARPELDTNRRFAEAAEQLGVELLTVDSTLVNAASGAERGLWYRGGDLLEKPPEVVLARVGNWRPESVLAALEVAVDGGADTPNPPSAIRAGRDHWQTVRQLAAADLPVPMTLAGADPEELAAAAAARLGFPVVVKQRRSRMGVGVVMCTARDQLESVLDSMWRVGDEVVVQRYVPTDGASLRLVVAGDEVVGAARFQSAPGEWRSNAARGGTASPHEPRVREVELALAASRALGLAQCGVDLLPGEETTIAELNPTPGFVRLEQASGVDVARSLLDHAVRREWRRGARSAVGPNTRTGS